MGKLKWYITTGFWHMQGVRVVMGGFDTKELAIQVRSLLEYKNKPCTYYIDSVPSPKPSKLEKS